MPERLQGVNLFGASMGVLLVLAALLLLYLSARFCLRAVRRDREDAKKGWGSR